MIKERLGNIGLLNKLQKFLKQFYKMSKRVSVDLMGFDSPEVSNYDPRPGLPFVQSISDDPFEFHLQKTFQNVVNSPSKDVKKSKLRFSYFNESLMNELDTSYDLLNGSYQFDDTFANMTLNSPLRRLSMSMENLTTYGVPISLKTIKKEANKVVKMLEDEHPLEEMLCDITHPLNNSTSSEDEFGLPKVLKLSICANTFDSKDTEEIQKRYKKLSISLQNINQPEILNTFEKNMDISNSPGTSSVNKKHTTPTEKPNTNETTLKIGSKIKLLQKGINLPNSLKTVKKSAEIGLKKGPIKAFAPVSQRLNTCKTLKRPSTCPTRQISNESNSSIIVPVASSTTDKKGFNLNNSRINRPGTAPTTRVLPKTTTTKPSTSIKPPMNPRNTLGNERKIPTAGGYKKN